MFLVLLLNALFALVFPLGKFTMFYAAPFFIVGMRMILGGLAFLGYQYFFNPKQFTIPRSVWWQLFLLAIFNIYITNSFELWGLQFMSSARACFIYNLSPFISALIAYFYFSEKLTFKKALGLIIGFTGFIPILYTQAPGEHATAQISGLSLADGALLIAATTIVYGWIILQDLVRNKHYSSIMANGVSMVGGGILSLAHSAVIESWYPSPVISWPPFIFWLSLLTLVSNILCNGLLGKLLKRYTATFLSFTNFTMPLFAALYDWILFGTAVSWDFFAGTIFVAIGLYLFYKEELAQGYILR